jgi:REP element-mobilizing transposase RayT
MTIFYRRNLPHIEEFGATYYVSFSTRREFILPAEARTLIYSHCLFENGGTLHMRAFVVMPDHVHMLFTPRMDEQKEPYALAKIMKGIKGASSHSVNKLLERKGPLWEPESFDRIIRSDEDFEIRLVYIIENPIAAGLAQGPDDYRWAWRERKQPKDWEKDNDKDKDS